MRVFKIVILLLVFGSAAFAQTEAEITVPKTFIRKSPDATSQIVRNLSQGDKVVLEKAMGPEGWALVSTDGGKTRGWISLNTFKTVKPAETQSGSTDGNASTSGNIRIIRNGNSTVISPAGNSSAPKNTASAAPVSAPAASSPASAGAALTANSEPQSQASAGETASVAPAEVVEDNEVLRVDTEEVNLNVRVVDEGNRIVKNLGESQFKVYEDGVLQPITAFSSLEVPVVNALVIDNSRSLRSQLEKIVEAGKIIVGTNRPVDKSAIIRFVGANKIETVRDFTDNKNLLNDALSNLYTEGGQTALIDAIFRSAVKIDEYQKSQDKSKDKDDVKLRALILVSDGDDRGSTYTEQKLFELLRRLQVQIYVIGFPDGLSDQPESDGISRRARAKDLLNRLANETGGKIYFPASENELPAIAKEISGDLRTQYLVSYTPTNDTRDGRFRKITVEITKGANNERRIGITRSGRTAARN